MTERLRVLVATPQLPGRHVRHGGGTYVAELLRALAEQADVSLLSLARPSESGHETELSPPLLRATAIRHLWNADLTPVELFASRARIFWRTAVLRLPLPAAKFRSAALARALRKELAAFRPHAVCLEFSVTAQYLPLLAGVPSILTDHEAGGPGARWSRYVRTFYPLASLVQTVTEEDAATLRNALPGSRIEVRPVIVPIPEHAVDPAAAGPCIGFLGNYSHAPNREAAAFVARALLPLLRERHPAAELLLAGDQTTPDIAALGSLPGIRSLGSVPAPADLLARIRCLVAPVFSGGGTRVKVLTSLAHGVPVATNALGARGLLSAPAGALTLGETAEELCAVVLGFLRDPAAAARAGRLGREWCRSALDASAVARSQLERIRTLADRTRR